MAYKSRRIHEARVATSMGSRPSPATAGLQVIVRHRPGEYAQRPRTGGRWSNVPYAGVNSLQGGHVEAVGYLPDFSQLTLCEGISCEFQRCGAWRPWMLDQCA